jgi:hypothetical protein
MTSAFPSVSAFAAFRRLAWLAAVLLVASALATGCGGGKRSRTDWVVLRNSATPPAFLTGPSALLLTNLDGFTAHATLETSSIPKPAHPVEGELFGRGERLLFTPEGGSEVAYIWDVPARSGFVLDAPVQGFAPVASDFRVTNIAMTPLAPASANGHSCSQVTMTMACDDGSIARFHIWRAVDLNGFPVRIQSAGGGAPFTLDLTRIRMETPPADVFQPPSDFTRYAGPDALMSERFAREHPIRQEEILPGPPPDMRPEPGSPRPGY